VSRPPFPKNLRAFQRQFATEEACHQYLAVCRWPEAGSDEPLRGHNARSRGRHVPTTTGSTSRLADRARRGSHFIGPTPGNTRAPRHQPSPPRDGWSLGGGVQASGRTGSAATIEQRQTASSTTLTAGTSVTQTSTRARDRQPASAHLDLWCVPIGRAQALAWCRRSLTM